MRLIRALLMLLAVPLAIGATEPKLVPDVSQRQNQREQLPHSSCTV